MDGINISGGKMSVIPLKASEDIFNKLIQAAKNNIRPDQVTLSRYKAEIERTLNIPSLKADGHKTLSVIYTFEGNPEKVRFHGEKSIELDYNFHTVSTYAISLSRIGLRQLSAKVRLDHLHSFEAIPEYVIAAARAAFRTGQGQTSLDLYYRWKKLKPEDKDESEILKSITELVDFCSERNLTEADVCAFFAAAESSISKHFKIASYNFDDRLFLDNENPQGVAELISYIDADEEVVDAIEESWQDTLLNELDRNPAANYFVATFFESFDDIKEGALDGNSV